MAKTVNVPVGLCVKTLTPVEARLFVTLLAVMEDGRAEIGASVLARESGLAESTVKAALKRLTELGVVSKKTPAGLERNADGTRRCTEYTLNEASYDGYEAEIAGRQPTPVERKISEYEGRTDWDTMQEDVDKWAVNAVLTGEFTCQDAVMVKQAVENMIIERRNG